MISQNQRPRIPQSNIEMLPRPGEWRITEDECWGCCTTLGEPCFCGDCKRCGKGHTRLPKDLKRAPYFVPSGIESLKAFEHEAQYDGVFCKGELKPSKDVGMHFERVVDLLLEETPSGYWGYCHIHGDLIYWKGKPQRLREEQKK